jgi:hypothetical protein
MYGRVMKKTAILLMVAVFLLVSGLSFAAGKKWAVIKDSKGVCKVIQVKAKTPKTIAGPFATKAEAMKAKDSKCPKKKPK